MPQEACLIQSWTCKPRSSSGGGRSREEIIGELAKGIEARCPPLFDTEMVGKKYPTDYNESMKHSCFTKNVLGTIECLKIMHQSLANI